MIDYDWQRLRGLGFDLGFIEKTLLDSSAIAPQLGNPPATTKDTFFLSEAVDKEKLRCNKPVKTPNHPSKSHIVKACYPGAPEEGKLIRFGQQGVKGSPKKEGESEAYRARREAFKARHRKNIEKGKSSGAYWSNIWKWVE